MRTVLGTDVRYGKSKGASHTFRGVFISLEEELHSIPHAKPDLDKTKSAPRNEQVHVLGISHKKKKMKQKTQNDVPPE